MSAVLGETGRLDPPPPFFNRSPLANVISFFKSSIVIWQVFAPRSSQVLAYVRTYVCMRRRRFHLHFTILGACQAV